MTERTSSSFVFVHGAFHGGWCWSRVTRLLREAGHDTHTPSQTGLGDRRHLLSAQITMDTFVADIANLIDAEELERVILVSHSFGGRTAVGVADRMPERLAHLVFLDAAIPVTGLSRFESMSEAEQAERLQRAADFDGGLSVPPPPAQRFGLVDAGDIDWVNRHMTPQPVSVEASRLTLAHKIGNGRPATYLHCVDPVLPVAESSACYARSRADWTYTQLPAGHDAMVSAPGLVAQQLLAIVGH